MTVQLQAGMRVGVLGLGKAGFSTVRFLLNQGVEVKVSEQRAQECIAAETWSFLQQAGVTVETGGHDPAFLDELDLLIPGPGVPLQSPLIMAAKQQNIPIAGELALAAGRFTVPVIGITGSNGKTTVTSLCGTLLASAGLRPFVGGNIGTPLLDYFLDAEAYDVVVLELSSFQLDLAGTFRPDIGVLLNISPDHLDRHGSLAAYVAAKRNVFHAQRPGDKAILGADDQMVAATQIPQGIACYTFGHGENSDVVIHQESLLVGGRVGPEAQYALVPTRLQSFVNQLNAAAAVLAVSLLKLSPEQIVIGLQQYTPPPHRMAEIAEIGGVTFINDSKATNVGALEAALQGCAKPVVLIAGGRDKGSDYSELTELVRRKVKHLVLLGEAAPLMDKAWGHCVATSMVTSMFDAVLAAEQSATTGDVVLLAPGCASFDMFSGYEERGTVYSDCVRKLKQKRMENIE